MIFYSHIFRLAFLRWVILLQFSSFRFWWGDFFCSHVFRLDFLRWVILVQLFPVDFGEVLFLLTYFPLRLSEVGYFAPIFFPLILVRCFFYSHFFRLDFLRWIILLHVRKKTGLKLKKQIWNNNAFFKSPKILQRLLMPKQNFLKWHGDASKCLPSKMMNRWIASNFDRWF